jgi:hypothetical protein
MFPYVRLIGLLSGHFPSGFPTKILYAFFIFGIHVCAQPISSFSYNHPNNSWSSVQIIELLIFSFLHLPVTLSAHVVF